MAPARFGEWTGRPIGSLGQAWKGFIQPLPTRSSRATGDLSIRGGSKAVLASTRCRGCQGGLERARRLQKLWDTGAYDSLKALGREERVSGARVSQLVNLLHLAPEILAAPDVPEEEVPAGVKKAEVRAIARLRGHIAQRRAFAKRWPGVWLPATLHRACAMASVAACLDTNHLIALARQRAKGRWT